MLNHTYIGPTREGSFLVGYPTPGCDVLTVVCKCRTVEQAKSEIARLDAEQAQRDAYLQLWGTLAGFGEVA